MSIRSLADFLEKLDSAKQLRRITTEVSPVEEVSELARRAALESGPALVFQKLAGSQTPLSSNLLATEERIALALGSGSLADASARMPHAAAPLSGGWIDWLKAGFQTGIDTFAPRPVRTAACQQVVRLGRDVDLAELPALRLSADDAQPWLYGACVVSGGQQATTALGQFDLSILDRNRLAIRFGPRDPIARQVADCRTTGTKLPIAVLLGTAPALTLAAAARLYEPALDPLLLAGLLGAQALDIVSCRTVALQVPAEADIVIEGTIDPQAPPLTDVAPGACGGFRLPPSDAVEIQVTALTQRPQPLATASIPHAPPNEATAVARAIARLWLPVTKRLIPGLVDLDVPPTALAGQIAVLAIRKEFPGQASQAAAAWWGQHAGTTTKMIIVVDAEVDVRDAAGMWSEVAALADAGGDILFLDGPLNSRDQSAAAVGHRMAIDATSKLPGERGQSGLKRMLIGVVSH